MSIIIVFYKSWECFYKLAQSQILVIPTCIVEDSLKFQLQCSSLSPFQMRIATILKYFYQNSVISSSDCIRFQLSYQQQNMKPAEGIQKQKQAQKVKWINPLRNRIRVVPFVVPNEEERMIGLGSLVGEKWRIKKSLQAIIKQFQPIKKPKPGDCLYEYEEDGQTFPLFASMYRNHIDPKEEIIYIATFNSNFSQQNLKRFKKNTKAFFCDIKVKTYHFEKTDLTKFNPIQSESGDTYYDAALMNVYFAKNLPKKCYSIAILTDLLIYNGDNPVELLSERWVFGLGSIKDRTSVMSYTEMIKKGYQFKQIKEEVQQKYEDQFNLQMMQKVINHQLCHTFGMKHCIFYTCLMNGSNGYHEASVKPSHLCPVCLRKLQYSIGFDFVQRYEKLKEKGDQKSGVLIDLIRQALGENK